MIKEELIQASKTINRIQMELYYLEKKFKKGELAQLKLFVARSDLGTVDGIVKSQLKDSYGE